MRNRPLSFTRQFVIPGLLALFVACDGETLSGSATPGAGDGGPTAGPMVKRDGGTTMVQPGPAKLDGGPKMGNNPGSAPATPRPPVAINDAAKQIFPTGAVLLGTHRTACSSGLAAPGTSPDRWCAISLVSRQLGRRELWVINSKKVAAGDVKCDGSTPDCKKLSDDLFSGDPEDGPAFPTAHRFYGDTLIYYADAKSRASDLYKGPVYAWQPGWPAGKPIASDTAVLCSGHARANVAVCIQNITPMNVEPVQWDLHAGPIDGGPMKKIARITPSRGQNGASQWRSGFSADGSWFAYSTGGTKTTDTETLYAMKTADIGNETKVITVGTNISRWTMSADGKNWFYLRKYNYNREGQPSGDLYTAPFPDGADKEVFLAGKVGLYQVLADADDKDMGLAYLDGLKQRQGTFKLMRDVTQPEVITNVVPMTITEGTPLFSRDLSYAFFAKDADTETGLTDAWIAKLGVGAKGMEPTACRLTRNGQTEASLFGSPFNRSGGLAFFTDQVDLVTDSGEGWYASPSECTTAKPGATRFARDIDFWFIFRDDGMVYTDGSDGEVVTLRQARFEDSGKKFGAIADLQKGVDRMFALLPNFEGLMFTISGSTSEKQNGIYYMKLDLTAGTPAPRVDAAVGAPPSSAAAPDASVSVDAITAPDAGSAVVVDSGQAGG